MASENHLTGHDGLAAAETVKAAYEHQEYPRWEEQNGGRVLVAGPPGEIESENRGSGESGKDDEFSDLTKAQIVERYGLELDPNRNSRAEVIEAAKKAKGQAPEESGK